MEYTQWTVHELVEEAATTGVVDCIRNTQPQFSNLIEIEKAVRLAVLRETTFEQLCAAAAASTHQYPAGTEHLEPQCQK